MNMWNFYEVRGIKEEFVCCPKVNTGLFDSFKAEKNIKGVFCGHDHDNDYSGQYKGIELVYGRKTGYGSYGPTGQRGGTVIKLKEFVNDQGKTDFTFSYYIVQEDGSIVDDTGQNQYKGYYKFQSKCVL